MINAIAKQFAFKRNCVSNSHMCIKPVQDLPAACRGMLKSNFMTWVVENYYNDHNTILIIVQASVLSILFLRLYTVH